MTAREFHLGDILSITTGRLLSPSGVDGVYRLLHFLTGDHERSPEVVEALKAQLPALADIVVPAESEVADWEGWLAGQAAVVGEWHLVVPLAEAARNG